jgi:2-polyprenyl-6-methoxyphenol hydroxylase-like FAD-dependent oxidoreductase
MVARDIPASLDAVADRAATRTPLANRRITVVGAGIGGTVAAILAARARATVTLLDRGGGTISADSGMLLQPNGLAVLYGLGLAERLQRRGKRVSHLRVANAGDRTLLDAPIPRFGDGLDHALIVRRSDLIGALMELAAAQPGLERHFDAELREISPREGSFSFLAADGLAAATSDLVVGADGVHSRVRRRSGIPASVGRTWWYARGIGPSLPHVTSITEYWTKLGIFGVAPLDDATYFYAATHADPIASALRERDFEYFRRTWIDALPVAEPVLTGSRRFEDLLLTQVVQIECPHWSRGRVVLLGDAAHAMAPNLAQGASSALVDAMVLVWELTRTADQAAALQRYEARRRSAIRVVQRLAAQLGWLSHLTNPAMRWLRDGATRCLGSSLIGNVSMRLLEQTDPVWLRLAAEMSEPLPAA